MLTKHTHNELRQKYKKDMKLFIASLLIVAICIILLSVRLFFGRGFVKAHVDQNKAMRQRGIHCVQAQDAEARIYNTKQIKERITE